MQAHHEQGQQKGEHREQVVLPAGVNRAQVRRVFAIKSFPLILLASSLGILFTIASFAVNGLCGLQGLA